jgi:hypothetical protein
MGILSRKPAAVNAPEGISPQPNSDIEQGDQPSAIHNEPLSPTYTSAHAKWHLSTRDSYGDTALALFSNLDELRERISPAPQRALQRKIDFMTLPCLAVCYAFFYINKTARATRRFLALEMIYT